MRFRAIVLAFLGAGLALAADVTGKWTATVPGRDGATRDVTYTFKADGSSLTGTTTGMGGREMPISDGKVDGDKISFTVKVEFNGNSFVMKYAGTVSGDEIKFAQTREGGSQTREFTAKRAK